MTTLRANGAPEATDELYSLAWGIDFRANSYSVCNVNGVRFHTSQREIRRTTQNSGLVVDSEHNNTPMQFYGTLCDVIELEYTMGYRVVLFKCDWFDLNPRRNRIRKDYTLTCIDVSNFWYKDQPFIFALQAQQVFYVNDHSFGSNWKVVQKMQHRHIWDVPEVEDPEELENDNTHNTSNEAYQQSGESTLITTIEANDIEENQLQRDDDETETVDIDLVVTDDFIDDEEEEDDTLFDYTDDLPDEEEMVVMNDDDTDIED
ncbi:hypothetical protein MKW94_000249 [Papaver nudicaule]|uniref:DUF4216 domain-containing protein n=1 Tax=Papaver nudicaule TaxID=74823 RepID=A0AA41S351_PAPNU|nr:hypothetical protein [Papaver nudicaule]